MSISLVKSWRGWVTRGCIPGITPQCITYCPTMRACCVRTSYNTPLWVEVTLHGDLSPNLFPDSCSSSQMFGSHGIFQESFSRFSFLHWGFIVASYLPTGVQRSCYHPPWTRTMFSGCCWMSASAHCNSYLPYNQSTQPFLWPVHYCKVSVLFNNRLLINLLTRKSVTM